jgi:hypothetical protein
MAKDGMYDYERDTHDEHNVKLHPDLLDGLTPAEYPHSSGECPVCEEYGERDEYMDDEGREWHHYKACGYLDLYNG